MRQAQQTSEIRHILDKVKAAGGRFTTNFFLSDSLLEPSIAAGAVSVLHTGPAVLILMRKPAFDRLYFACSLVEALGPALAALPTRLGTPMITDVVDHRSSIGEPVRQLEGAGFSVYTEFQRMQRLDREAPPPDEGAGISFATPEEAEAVLQVIGSHFDPYAEHIPELDELRHASSSRTILLAREGLELAALLYYDRAGATTTLRYWLSLPAFRGRGHAGRLMRHYLRTCANARRFLLWWRPKTGARRTSTRTSGTHPPDLWMSFSEGSQWTSC